MPPVKDDFVPVHGISRPELHSGRIYRHIPMPKALQKQAQQGELLLHPGQASVFVSKARFRTVVAGRRWGKTQWACTELIAAAEEKPKSRCWYVAPTYAMAKSIAWEKLKELTPAWRIAKIHEVDLQITLKNGSTISLKGADKPDTLRGVGVHLLVLDEFQDMKETIYEAARPTLSDTMGRCIFIGTPKSYNQLFKMYQRGLGRNPQWQSWHFKTIDSPFIPEEEVEQARIDMDPRSFRQEYEASFETMGGRVYYDFDRFKNVGRFPYNPTLPIWIGQDFNVDPMSSVILQPQNNGDVWVVGELYLRNSNTEEVCRELKREFGRNIVKLANIYPDPAGNQRGSARGESDLAIFYENGFQRLLYRRKPPLVRDRIAAVNRLICNAKGERRLFVDNSAKHLIESLEQTVYKEGTNEVDKKPGVDHPSDALGYCVEYEFPLRKEVQPVVAVT